MEQNTSYKSKNGKTFSLLPLKYTIIGEPHIVLSDTQTIICISEKYLAENFTKA